MKTFRVTMPNDVKVNGSSALAVQADNVIIQEGCLMFFEAKAQAPLLTCAFAPGQWLRFSEVMDAPPKEPRRIASSSLWTPTTVK